MEEGLGAHQNAGGAKSALNRVVVQKRFLQRAEAILF
jgi:hypothetical protein